MGLSAADLAQGYQMPGPVYVRLSDLGELFAPNTIAALRRFGLEVLECEAEGEAEPFGAVEVHQLVDLSRDLLGRTDPQLVAKARSLPPPARN